MTGAHVQYSVTLSHTSVSAKWHLIPSSGFSRVHECDRHTDRRTTRGRVCLNRQNRWCFQRRRLKMVMYTWSRKITIQSGYMWEKMSWTKRGGSETKEADWERLERYMLFVLSKSQWPGRADKCRKLLSLLLLSAARCNPARRQMDACCGGCWSGDQWRHSTESQLCLINDPARCTQHEAAFMPTNWHTLTSTVLLRFGQSAPTLRAFYALCVVQFVTKDGHSFRKAVDTLK